MAEVDELSNTVDILGICETWARKTDRELGKLTDVHASTEPAHRQCRGYGGVAAILNPCIKYSQIFEITTKRIQSVGIQVGDVAILTAYVSPGASRLEFTDFLNKCRMLRTGKTLIMGDFNCRHKSWDTKTNSRGVALAKWAAKFNWTVSAPHTCTFHSTQGGSTIDIVLHRGVTLTAISTNREKVYNSDHYPVTFTVETKQTPKRTTTVIPRHQRSNPSTIAHAKQYYAQHLPKQISSIEHAEDIKALKSAYTDTTKTLLKPWLVQRTENPRKFRPGWSQTLDRLSRDRKKLYRKMIASESPEHRNKYAALDHMIKATVKRNKVEREARMQRKLAETKPGAVTRTVALILRCIGKPVAGDGLATRPQLVPAQFTEHVLTEQGGGWYPEMENFRTDNQFRKDLEAAIRMAPKQKATGPDGLFVEAFRAHTELCAKLLTTLWDKCGQLKTMLPAWSEGELIPIHKRGDENDPANYRPITLLSHARKAIESAVVRAINRSYKFHPSQLGFQALTGTETALIRHAANAAKMPFTAVLDLRKAYDLAPRQYVWELAHKNLPQVCAKMISGLLQPIKVWTRGDDSNATATVTSGVPQGSPLSPTLFNLLMDTLASKLDASMTQWMENAARKELWEVTMFADDVKLQASSKQALQALLDGATKWAAQTGMAWNVAKCKVLAPPWDENHHFTLTKQTVPNCKEVTYLGISVNVLGLGTSASIEKVKAARMRVRLLRSSGIHAGKVPGRTMLDICNAFIFSTATYNLHLVQHSHTLQMEWNRLEKDVIKVCFGCYDPHYHNRLKRIAGLPSLSERQEIALTAAHKRVGSRAASRNWDKRAKHDVDLLITVRQGLRSVEQLTLAEIRRRWAAEEQHIRRGRLPKSIDRRPPPALELRNLQTRRACLYWYCKANSEIHNPNNLTQSRDATEINTLLQQPDLTVEERKKLSHLFKQMNTNK